MYAAGHPPLPSFEVAGCSQNLPPHWWDVKDVPFLKTADVQTQKNYHCDTAKAQHTQLVLAGSAAALHTTMCLIANRAGAIPREAAGEAASDFWPPVWLQDGKANTADRRWPERLTGGPRDEGDYQSLWSELAMAHSDCYACHHDLKLPSWRQLRGYQGKPGRPPLRPWPLALVGLAPLVQDQAPSGPGGEFQKYQMELHLALSKQPFGKPEDVGPAAAKLEHWAHRVLEDLQGDFGNLAEPGAVQLRLLRALAALPPTAYPDYDSARQIAWAFRSIYAEWQTENPALAGARDIQAILDRWEKQLNLKPDSLRQERATLVSEMLPREGFGAPAEKWKDKKWQGKTGKQGFLEVLQDLENKELEGALDRMRNHDPVAFKKDCRELLGLLPAR